MQESEVEFLLDLLRKSNFSGPHLEVGTAAGGTLWQMMRLYEKEVRPRFVVVDPMKYFPDQLSIVSQNLQEHGLSPSEVDFRVGTSVEIFAASEAAGERFDFMLIDGAHKIHYVTRDLKWTRLLNPGGLVCFHDYNEEHKGVRWPIDRFLRKNPAYEVAGREKSLLAVRKKERPRKPEVSAGDVCWASFLGPVLQMERNFRKHLIRSGK